MLRGAGVLLVVLGACADPEEPASDADTSPPAPLQAGVTTLTHVDPRGHTLEIEVWYPAWPAAGAEPSPYPELPVVIDAYRDAPPAPGPFPMVAFSHGYGGIRYQSAFLCEALARAGYVVIAPDHEGTVLLALDLEHMAERLLERPDDVRYAVDAVVGLDDGPLAGVVEDGPYVMIGHSMGTFTTLAIAGATPAYDGVAAVCAETDHDGCGFIPDFVDGLDLAANRHDPRVSAAVLLSPGGWYAFGADGEGLAALPPTLVLGGDKDSILDYDDEIRGVWARTPTPRRLATLPDAGHYAAFSDMCRALPFWEDCLGPDRGFMASDVGQALTEAIVLPFVDAVFGADVDLDVAVSGLDGVVWEVEP